MKYNMKHIMQRAWNLVKTCGITISTALKAAWATAKAMIAADKKGEESGWNYRTSANDWCKYGKNRTYITTRIYTNAWNLKREVKLGYIDNMTGAFCAAE